jgi:hypothetical protein
VGADEVKSRREGAMRKRLTLLLAVVVKALSVAFREEVYDPQYAGGRIDYFL